MDYFELYRHVFLTVRDDKPRNGQALIKTMNKKPIISNALNKGEDTKVLSQYTIEVLENLINEGLIKGSIIRTKDGKSYKIENLTTVGHLYLQKFKELTIKERLKKTLQEEGVPLTPQEITKFIAKLLY